MASKVKAILSREYLAGFFDADGSVQITKSQRNTRPDPTYCMRSVVSNNYKAVLEEMKEMFGGTITPRELESGKIHHTWDTSAWGAYKFLSEILPFLRVKKRQVELALRFQRSIPKMGTHRTTGINMMYERAYQEMKKLKKEV